MNDELTPGERDAMRLRISAGARAITPVRAHRSAVIAGAIAAVLVVGIAGGVAATSMLNAAPVVAPPSSTASTAMPLPVPMVSATPTSAPPSAPTPALGVGQAPFDSACMNVLTADQLTSLTGHEMANVTSVPHDSRFTVRGGIFCDWASSDEYQAVQIVVAVLTADEDLPIRPDGCENSFCITSSSSAGVQIRVKYSSREPGADRTEKAAVVADEVRTRLADYPAGVPATPTGAWWTPWKCADLSASIDAKAFGYDVVTTGDPANEVYWTKDNQCRVTLERPDGAVQVNVTMVPGGAVGLDAMAASAAGSLAVSVSGSTKAYWVELQSKYDGGGGRELWVTDGTNLLTVGSVVAPGANSLDSSPDLPILLAEQLWATV